MAKRNADGAAGPDPGFPEIRVVEASAGAGKTYALAARYLRLLMEPGEELGAILAITFTNKATREMKGRILDLLKKLALDAFDRPEERDALSEKLPASGGAVASRAAALVDRIVRNYHSFQVQTIDSFINSLLSGCAYELNLSPGFSITRDRGDYLAWSVDRCVERAAREPEIRETIEAFVTHYLVFDRGARWLPKEEILRTVAMLSDERDRHGGRFVASGVSPEPAVDALRRMLLRLQARIPEGTHANLAKALRTAVSARGRLDLGALSSVYFVRDEFPMTKGREAPPEIRELWRRIRAAIPEAAEAEARAFFDCDVRLFGFASDECAARAREDDLVFLGELNRRARELLASGRVGVPELYLRFATAFRHFLIDEFQDTSGLQWMNLEGLVREALSTGGSLFYVGDRKQAIYRFRGGDAELFDRVAADLAGQAPVRRETLGLNRRSCRAIVEFNNEIFSPGNVARFVASLSPERDDDPRALRPEDIDRIAEVFGSARQTHLPGRAPGFVTVEGVDGDRVRERLVPLIRELCGRFEPREIAVLARGNEEVEEIASWLSEEEIAAASERTLSVAHHPLVREICALLRFLDSPVADLAFAAWITGAIFTAAAGVSADEMRGFIFSLRDARRRGGTAYLYRAFRDRYPAAWAAHFEELFRNVGFVPLYELATDILRRFGVHRRFGEYRGFFLRFLELIREQEKDRGDIASFLAYLEAGTGEDLFVRYPGVNAVRVMTIHKAKGLGFPAVVVPFLDFDPGGARGAPRYRTVRRGEDAALVRLEKKYTRLSPRLRDEDRDEHRRRVADELNAVYVAFTRAAEELRVLLPAPKRGRNAAEGLIPAAFRERGEPRAGTVRGQAARPSAVDSGPPDYRDWIAFLREECVDPGEILRRGEIERGEVLHCILALLGDLSGGGAEEALRRAAAGARERFPGRRCLPDCEAVVRRLLDRPWAARLFAPGAGAEVFTEKEIADASGGIRRIDRLIVRPESVRVVDFKSGAAHREAHRAQLRGYAALAAARYPGRAVAGTLVYLDRGEAEEVAL
ncbi:MAG: UvrD-helicase domain-containing protein [Candidatus Aureabacteria bacterium]|nr:UvrD-helicase domain-containing protein [Candidatus Auribacterota bacterium]NLW93009.1 UvrD-helicase domain-containing protein [Chlamydiota bacterium]HOE27873.1 UvrD-helicase domain-containing protein [bacterium]HQM52172.1 UvrD-helicase domain-containing protein [bacterium]